VEIRDVKRRVAGLNLVLRVRRFQERTETIAKINHGRGFFEGLLSGPIFRGVILLIAGLNCGALGAAYNVTDLGTLGGTSSEAMAINASGQIVGNSTTSGNAESHAFLYSNGTMTDLGTLGGTGSSASDINNAGQVVGEASTTGNAAEVGFLYSHGVMTSLASFGGPFGISAFGINDSGEISGAINAGTDGTVTDPCILSNGVVTDLGTLLPGFGVAEDINNSGEAVGRSTGPTINNRLGIVAFSYSNGMMTNLNLQATINDAFRINNAGEIVGDSDMIMGFVPEGFLFSNGVITLLPGIAGTESTAVGINDAGEVVGSATFAKASGIHAYIYSNGMMTDLNSLIPSNSGWVLSQATDINDSGLIVGMGTNSEGQTDAFLLTPVVPEPASISVLLLGGMGLLARRRYSFNTTMLFPSTSMS
jgi:probable HAF family extracellular repeat protein